MDGTSVRRCVAVAAHGRRCQQTPFRGGPYCWHHTRSRKVWAPSRPVRTGPHQIDVAIAEVVPVPSEPLEDRLSRLLAPEDLDRLVRFLEEVPTGALRLEKHEGAVTAVRLTRVARRRPAGAGGTAAQGHHAP